MSEKYCVTCGQKALARHFFCGACGHAFPNNTSTNPNQPAHYAAFVPNQADIATYQYHRQYLNKIDSCQNWVFLFFFMAALITIVFNVLTGLIGWRSIQDVSDSMWLFGFFLISCIVIKFTALDYSLAKLIYGRGYRYKDHGEKFVYQELVSATNHKNEAVCIFCGNKRFFRKGIYASNSCTVNCTKCQTYLYTE